MQLGLPSASTKEMLIAKLYLVLIFLSSILLVSFLSLWQNAWDNQLKWRKGLLWFTVSYRLWSPGPVALGLWQHSISRRSAWQRRPVQLTA
jgi:hypothetical protein